MRKYKITMAVHGELIGVLEGEGEAEGEGDSGGEEGGGADAEVDARLDASRCLAGKVETEMLVLLLLPWCVFLCLCV